MKQLLAPHKFWTIGSLLIIDSLFFSFTNPQRVASWLLIVGVLLFVATLYCLLTALLVMASWYGLPSGPRPARLAKLMVGIAGFLIGLQSIGELSTRDIWVLLPLGVISYLYSNRVWARAPVR